MKHLQDILDRKNFLKLVRAAGGSRIWVPRPGNLGHRDRAYFRQRDARIRNLRKKGRSVPSIAKEYGISLKRVYGVLKKR